MCRPPVSIPSLARRTILVLWLAGVHPLAGADLTLLSEGRSNYQIVVPDRPDTPAIAECLDQTARLVGTAFKANGAEVPVVREAKRDAARPAILLGNTRFAREHGIDVDRLRDWSYVQRAVGADIIIAGRDHAAVGRTENPRRPNWDRVGTAKGAVDFLRQFMGVRFLYPDVPPYTPVSGAARIDLLASPAIEFLPRKQISVPTGLDVAKTPMLRVNTAHPAGGGFYDLAHHRFPRVDEVFGGHTWERAVPAELFAEHPEYFALVNGSRLKPDGNAQYCLSNADVEERIYRDLASWLDRGYGSVDLGQPDGFRPCECESCEALYGTGKDWGEKIWIFNRGVAERLEKSHPGRQVTMMSYILTASPPKTFTRFPQNTCIMLTGTNEEDFAPWRGIDVPRGFTGYIYNWCPNLGTRYTPMRTPGYVERQVKRLAANKVQAIYRDGPGQLFGLEGPVYYVMGRMFDDPQRSAAKDLLPEFFEGAFPDKSIAFSMRAFYDELYHAIALYSDHIGTRCDAWTFQPLPGEGRARKTVQDPFALVAFLYPPQVLESLESHLALAEQIAASAKVKTRLALVRTEFEYLKHFARVVHLHQAYRAAPDSGSLGRLLDAIDARNAFIATLYDKRGHGVISGNWAYPLFPFAGHDAKHLRLAYDGYQEPYANTCFNWDTQALRTAPMPGKKKLTVAKAAAPVTLDSPQWKETAAHQLALVPPLSALPQKTSVRVLYDRQALYIRAECGIRSDAGPSFPAFPRDRRLWGEEAFDIYLAPRPAADVFYRFATGANGESKYDAVNGLIADAMDPRHGKDDPTWNGPWQSETRFDASSHRWHALVTIPFKTLDAPPPAAGITWRANFARYHWLPRGRVDRAIWSSTPAQANIDDRAILGEIVFE